MAKQKRKALSDRVGGLAGWSLEKIVDSYVFLLFAIYPIYYQDKYYNMGDAKWYFFKTISSIAIVVVAMAYIWFLANLAYKKELQDFWINAKSKLVVTDYFVIAYAVLCIISSIITPYKTNVIWGYSGWYMGLVAQIGFVLIYFFVSRFWKWDTFFVAVYLAIAFVVFFFGIIMRFHIDPMEMYIGVNEAQIKNFLSTLGQATWYSSYVCIIFPVGLIAYWILETKWKRILSGIFLAAGFMTLVTQNSDSAYIAIVGIMFMLFWVSMEKNRDFKRFLEILVICLASFKFMGVCQMIFSDIAVQLDTISVFMSQSIVTWILLILSVVAYICFNKYIDKNTDFEISKYKFIRWILLSIMLVLVVLGVIYIVLNTLGLLPAGLSSDNNYLLFNDRWGNNRGSSWMCAVGTVINCDILRKLFGAGPDGFADLVYRYYGDVLVAKWGENTMLTCAHNEWLNSIVNTGILGATAYIGIFVCSVKRCVQEGKKHPQVYAVAIAVVAYMCHNFFCYQQIICTPTIFILMGVAEAIIRRGDDWDELQDV